MQGPIGRGGQKRLDVQFHCELRRLRDLQSFPPLEYDDKGRPEGFARETGDLFILVWPRAFAEYEKRTVGTENLTGQFRRLYDALLKYSAPSCAPLGIPLVLKRVRSHVGDEIYRIAATMWYRRQDAATMGSFMRRHPETVTQIRHWSRALETLRSIPDWPEYGSLKELGGSARHPPKEQNHAPNVSAAGYLDALLNGIVQGKEREFGTIGAILALAILKGKNPRQVMPRHKPGVDFVKLVEDWLKDRRKGLGRPREPELDETLLLVDAICTDAESASSALKAALPFWKRTKPSSDLVESIGRRIRRLGGGLGQYLKTKIRDELGLCRDCGFRWDSDLRLILDAPCRRHNGQQGCILHSFPYHDFSLALARCLAELKPRQFDYRPDRPSGQ